MSASTREVYDWKKNIETFFLELAEKQRFATNYFNALRNVYQPQGKWEEPPAAYARPGTSELMTALEAATVQLYNGAAWLVVIRNGVVVYDGAFTNSPPAGSRFISCWRFHPNNPVGQKWEFKPNQNNYVFKIVYDEFEGHVPIRE